MVKGKPQIGFQWRIARGVPGNFPCDLRLHGPGDTMPTAEYTEVSALGTCPPLHRSLGSGVGHPVPRRPGKQPLRHQHENIVRECR